jgi:flagellar hook-associated protein 1 FlgK
MSLSLALNNAISGLRINQQSIGVLSQNIANVNTPGYSRQILNQSALLVDGVGSGVKLDEITRKIDVYLKRSTQTQGSNFSGAEAIDDYYQRFQAVLGQPGSNNTLDAVLTTYFNSIQQLAESPEINSLKSNAVSAGNRIADQLSSLAANAHDLRYEADREISDSVNQINGALERLKGINKAISQAKALGQPTTGFMDVRDRELTTISQYINISTTFNNTGAVSIVAGDGVVLLEEGVSQRLRYTRAGSLNTFIEDGAFAALEVVTVTDSGQEVGNAVRLLSAGRSSDVVSRVQSGKLYGLQQMRDVKMPAILDQLDMLSSRLRDQVNSIHNAGSSYPPATSLTGERAVSAVDQYSWTGTVRIAVLQTNGKPVSSRYADETYTGIRPLELNLGRLDSGDGNGKPRLQTIVDEINNHFGSPGTKAKLGNLNNIQIASNSKALPGGAPPRFNFDLDLDNISESGAQVFVTDIAVVDDTAAVVTNVTQTQPTVTLSPAASYVTTAASTSVVINLTDAPGAVVGDTVFLQPPSGAVNGIPVGDLSGYFTVTAVSGNSITIDALSAAAVAGPVNDPGAIQMYPPYHKVPAGIKDRTRDQGQMQVDFSANPTSTYYDITLTVTVVDDEGTISTAPVTYRVYNQVEDIFNTRYDAQAIGAPGTLVTAGTSQHTLRAILVDAQGQELPTVNGKYIDGEAYLKLIGGNAGETYAVAIDELSSKQLGKPDGVPPELGTNRGFSHYFGLNNFFSTHDATITGEATKGSAYALKVADRLVENTSLISIGNLTLQRKNATTDGKEVYTYARFAGDNALAQRLGKLNTQIVTFDSAGGLPPSQQSMQGFSSDLMGFVSQRSAEATDNAENSKVLFEGFKSKSDAVSGVNLDEELANTIVFQNAYSATARVITTVNKMYDDLLQSF